MQWTAQLYIIYLFAGYFTAIRFRNHNYFYYLFALAAIDPLFFLLQIFIKVDFLIFFTLALIIMFWAVPGSDLRKKILVTFGAVLTIVHNKPDTLITMLVCEIVFLVILLSFWDEFKNEFKQQGKGSIFLLLLCLETIHNALKVFLYVENISLAVSLFGWMIIKNILILVLLTIAGPHAKTAINFLNKNSASINDLSKKVIYDITGNILLNYQGTPNNSPQQFQKNIGEANHDLTRSENKILNYLSQGLTNSEIADQCHVSKKTIENHLQHIREKLDMSSMLEVRKYAHQNKAEDIHS